MTEHHIRPMPGGSRESGPPAPTLPGSRTTRGRAAGGTPSAPGRSLCRSARRGVLSLLLAGLSLFLGCETAPEEVRELEARSTEAITNYDANAIIAVESLLTAYRETSRRELALVTRGDVDTASRDATYTSPEGELVTIRAVEVAEVVSLLDAYRAALDLVDAEVAGFREGWEDARGDYVEAMALRETLYQWLTREGIQPEHIDAIGRALADAIEKRGRP